MNEAINALNQRQAALFCVAILKSAVNARKNGGMNTVPVMIGLPGSGKTSIGRQIAKQLAYEGLIVVTPTLHTTFDLRGLPHVVEIDGGHETRFAASQILPKSGKWLILIDELNDCPPHEQSGFYQLLLDRQLGEYHLPEDCDIIGATNDDTMGACANPMSTAIKTRIAPVYLKNDLDQSLRYGLKNEWNSTVLGFMRFKPEVLTGFDPDDFAGGSTPRGLEQLSMLEQSGFTGDNDIDLSLCQSLLGTDHGTQYATFRRLALPELQPVFDTPETADIPLDRGAQFAFSMAIVTKCATSEDFSSVCKYADRLERVECIGLVVDTCRKNKSFEKTAAFAKFCAKHGNMII